MNRNRSLKVLAAILVCVFISVGLAYGQGVGASGDLRGTVSDPNGAVV